MNNSKRGINATVIKLVAIVCMLIDHVAAGLLYRMIDVGMLSISSITILGEEVRLEIIIYQLMRGIGRISFPIFCFFIVQGFLLTRKRWKYAARLLLFALISEIPFDFMLYGRFFYWGYQNVYFTLLIGLLVIWLIDITRNRVSNGFFAVLLRITTCLLPTVLVASEIEDLFSIFMETDQGSDLLLRIIWLVLAVIVLGFTFIYEWKTSKEKLKNLCSFLTIASAGIILAELLSTDYSGLGVATIVIMYVLAKRKVLGISMGCLLLSFFNIAEIPSFLCVPLIAAYNGERGKGMKYFFYAFYPVHITIIAIIARVLDLI